MCSARIVISGAIYPSTSKLKTKAKAAKKSTSHLTRKINQQTKIRDDAFGKLTKIKEEYVGELLKTGVPKGRIKQALKTPVLGQSAGLIGKSESFRSC